MVNSSDLIYDQEPATVTEDDEMSKEKEIDKLMALISLSFKKIYKPTNNNLRTSSNTSRANQDNSPRINRGTGNMEQADWKDDTDDESDDQELRSTLYVHGTGFNNEHPEQPESVTDAYLEEQGDTNITIDSLDMCYDREQDDQDDTDELAQECDLLAFLIKKLNVKIDDSKNVKIFEFIKQGFSCKLKAAGFKDLKKFQAELDKYHDVNYASKVAIDCAKAKGDLMSYKIKSKKSSNEYTRKINDLNQTISDMKKELFAHQETIYIMPQEKEAQIKSYKTRKDKELDKVIALKNKVKVLE
ncbi:hypothetical protein Tco_0868519 [Tanacetum coccineum]